MSHIKKSERKTAVPENNIGYFSFSFKAPFRGAMGHAVAHLVEALRYKPEGRGFDSRWCHWNFSLT